MNGLMDIFYINGQLIIYPQDYLDLLVQVAVHRAPRIARWSLANGANPCFDLEEFSQIILARDWEMIKFLFKEDLPHDCIQPIDVFKEMV